MGIAVAREAICMCDMGEVPNPLQTITNFVLSSDVMTVATILDGEPGANLETFGLCIIQSAEEEAPIPCEPGTAVWAVGAVNVLIPEPMLTQESILVCMHGGVITIVEPGQFSLIAAL
jgi:hypothetical protein